MGDKASSDESNEGGKTIRITGKCQEILDEFEDVFNLTDNFVRPPIIHTYHRKGKRGNNQDIMAANSVREGGLVGPTTERFMRGFGEAFGGIEILRS